MGRKKGLIEEYEKERKIWRKSMERTGRLEGRIWEGKEGFKEE